MEKEGTERINIRERERRTVKWKTVQRERERSERKVNLLDFFQIAQAEALLISLRLSFFLPFFSLFLPLFSVFQVLSSVLSSLPLHSTFSFSFFFLSFYIRSFFVYTFSLCLFSLSLCLSLPVLSILPLFVFLLLYSPVLSLSLFFFSPIPQIPDYLFTRTKAKRTQSSSDFQHTSQFLLLIITS